MAAMAERDRNGSGQRPKRALPRKIELGERGLKRAKNDASGDGAAAHAAEAVERTGDQFGRFAAKISAWLGSKWAFVFAALVIVLWAATGPLFHYSDTWQLVINTGTTIVTFLMVFLIQNTQNRDARAINLKLNELIRAIDAARDQMIDIESLSDVELKVIQEKFEKIKAAVGDLPAEG
jgi:low affinity Fe/Cu permease